MRNLLTIDLNTERPDPGPIIVRKADEPRTDEEINLGIITDIWTLCEGLCLLMHIAEGRGVQTSPETLRRCIAHLTAGFGDASYQVRMAKVGE